MLLFDDVPSKIRNNGDIERHISAFRRWNASDSKDVSPVFPRDLLEFTNLLVDKLSVYIEQRDNPVSPTIPDSDKDVCTKPSTFRR